MLPPHGVIPSDCGCGCVQWRMCLRYFAHRYIRIQIQRLPHGNVGEVVRTVNSVWSGSNESGVQMQIDLGLVWSLQDACA